MALESEKIRREIIHILEDEGRLRSVELVESVCKSVKVSPKPVYRELNYLSESGAIKRIEHNRANIEYESIDFEDTTLNFASFFKKQLSEFDIKLTDFHDSFQKKEYLQQMFALRPLIQALQNIDADYTICLEINILQKSRQLKEIRKLIDKRWKNLLGNFHIFKSTKAVNDMLLTLRAEVVKNFKKYENYKNPPTIIHKPM